MSLKISLGDKKKSKTAFCEKCKSSNTSEYLHIYLGIKREKLIGNSHINTKNSELEDQDIDIYCSKCLNNELKEQEYFDQMNKSQELQIANYVEKEKQINKINQRLALEIKNRDKQIASYKEFIVNADCEKLVRGMNYNSIVHFLACLKETALEIKDIYQEDFNLKINQFEDIEATSNLMQQNLKHIFYKQIERALSEVEDKISNDLLECRANDEKAKSLLEQFVHQFQDALKTTSLETQEFSNFVDQQMSKRKIQAKEAVLEKIILIREMALKQLKE